MLILEMGSGDTCKNDLDQIRAMIDAVAAADLNKRCILKWQLFLEQKFEHVDTLSRTSFRFAFDYAWSKGFKTTASIFDETSLKFLLQFNVPFIKLACRTNEYEFRKDAHGLIGYIVRNKPLILSCESHQAINDTIFSEFYNPLYDNILACVPHYPAVADEYLSRFDMSELVNGISDHTIGLGLYKAIRPRIFEKHFVLSWQTSLDKDWAVDENSLKELIRLEANET